ncbi:hypothetical protein [Vibrio campbellii]|uniref:hypothetical protein n=1 Tax=Vibrio campbellii TaxID=680 RepID=UPI0040573B8A
MLNETPQTKTDLELAHEWMQEQKMHAAIAEIFGATSEEEHKDYKLDEYELHKQEQEYESRFNQVTA